MHARALFALFSLLPVLLLSPAAQAQSRVMKFTGESLPPRLLVKKGTTIEVSGELRSGALPTTFVLKSGNITRDSTQTEGKWTLKWDPSRELTSTCYLTLIRIEPNGQEVRMLRATVIVLDGAPFAVTAPKEYNKTDGPLAVEVTAIGQLKMAGGEVLVDGKRRGAALDAAGKATVHLTGLKPGAHQVAAKVFVEGGGDFETEPVKVLLNAKVTLLRPEVGPIDLRKSLPHLPLRVQIPDDVKAESAEFFLDGSLIGRSEAPPFDDVPFPAAGLPTGMHTLSVRVVTKDGIHHVSPDLTVQVIGNAQNEFVGWHERFRKMLDDGAAVRAQYKQAEQAYIAGQATIGDLYVALKKLYNSDLTISQSVESVTVPVSIPESSRQEMKVVLQNYATGYSQLVLAERSALRDIQNASGMGGQGQFNWRQLNSLVNKALLLTAASDERLAGVAQRLVEQASREDRVAIESGSALSNQSLSYPVIGKAPQDFNAWRLRLTQVSGECDALRQAMLAASDQTERDLALRKLLGADIWLAENLERLTPPKSVPEALRQTLTIALQRLAQAHKTRAQADRLMLQALEAETGVGRTQVAPGPKLSGDPKTLFAKFSVLAAESTDKISSVAQKLGIEE